MYTDYQWEAPEWWGRPAWLTRRVLIVVSATVAAIAMLAGSAFAWSATRPEPFRATDPQVVFGGVYLKEDNNFHIGVASIDANGKDVKVLEVTPLMTGNVEFLGAVTSYGKNAATWGGPGGGGNEFPPAYMSDIHPINQVIPASETAYIREGWDKPLPVIVSAGFHLTHGVGAVNGVRVVYLVGGKKHTTIARIAVVACDNGCDKQAKRDRDFYDRVAHSFADFAPPKKF